MRLVTNTEGLADALGHKQAIELIAQAGFDGVDCSFFDMKEEGSVWMEDHWKDFAMELRSVAEDKGLVFRQAHAPFHTTIGEEPYDSQMRQKILRSMEAAALLGVENIVVHAIRHLNYHIHRERLFEMNLDFYRSLIPYCEEFGIRVCVENVYRTDRNRWVLTDGVCTRPEEFSALLDEINSPWIGGCLDIGHAALVSQDPADMIRRMGKRIRCLHVHDVDYTHDNHTMPFTQKLDWASITQALGQIDYRGDFTFEATQSVLMLPQELWPDGLKMLEKVGRYLIRQIELNRPAGN